MSPIKSDQFLNKDIQAVDFQGVEIFKKSENLMDSEIFGIKFKWVLLAAGLVAWLMYKRK